MGKNKRFITIISIITFLSICLGLLYMKLYDDKYLTAATFILLAVASILGTSVLNMGGRNNGSKNLNKDAERSSNEN